MIVRVLFLVGFLGCLAIEAAETRAANSEQFWEFSSGDWYGGAYKNQDGSFSHCYIEAAYQSGITLAIGITSRYEINIVLNGPSWGLEKDDTYDVDLWVDRQNLGRHVATAADRTLLLITAGPRSDVLLSLRRGRQLRVVAAQETFYFSLTGSNIALGRVLECVDLAVAMSPSRKNPFAAKNHRNDASDPEENEHVVRALLVASGMENPVLIDPRHLDNEGAAYAWSSGSMFGAMFAYDISETRAETLSNEVLANIAAECAGDYGTQSNEAWYAGASLIKQFAGACRSNADPSFYFAGTTVETRETIILIMNYTEEDPETLADVNRALGEVMSVLVKQ